MRRNTKAVPAVCPPGTHRDRQEFDGTFRCVVCGSYRKPNRPKVRQGLLAFPA